jgi:hypothetical protein
MATEQSKPAEAVFAASSKGRGLSETMETGTPDPKHQTKLRRKTENSKSKSIQTQVLM